MSDTMKTQPFDVLLRRILTEYEASGAIFGIHKSLFFRPRVDSPYASELFGQQLATPIGPAAGPHTQLTQNIVAAWLSGGRFMELKTVQIMDELEIGRPCIDMEDEGYNVEWSQELKLRQSADEYVKAWALIHLLPRLLGFEEVPFGTIFNMSVGYNLEGVKSAPMVRFMDTLADASAELAEIQAVLHKQFPQFADIEIPTQLTDNVTLSTMHGCPPDEIEAIARHLLVDRGLHTIVKLNPTLLGKERVMGILHDHLGYTEIDIPNRVFEHDLQYGRALALIRSLQATAAEQTRFLGVKLSNTLAMANHKRFLPGDEMYMSGRALFPITINLFHKLAQEFNGQLNVSYSAGADALNVADILAAGALPVTAASDLLKPGGYSRLIQWLEKLEVELAQRNASSLAELAADKLSNLERTAANALVDPRYKKSYHPYGLPKVAAGLELFDCVDAPCKEGCAVEQDVPEYAWLIARGEYDRALEVILARNPLPGTTGYVCTHVCQTRCTRNNYDEPVAIRALKRFAVHHGGVAMPTAKPAGKRVAVIGSGPSGLAAASFLALNGVKVTIFEARAVAGGMLAIAPGFRLPPAVVQQDVDRITGMGVELELNHRVTVAPQQLLAQGFDAVYVACGFQQDARLNIEGMDGEGVFTALDLLERVARGETPDLGERVLVIGGGNTAMDAARTAQRLTGRPSTIVYRRTLAEMPAEEEELAWLFEEGNQLVELVSPARVVLQGGRVAALECLRNQLGEADASGRRRPVPVPGSEFRLAADSIVVAIGQNPDVAFLDGSQVNFGRDGAILVDEATGRAAECIYAGGDATRGPAIIIQACADGRRAAEAICAQFGLPFEQLPALPAALTADEIAQVKGVRARKLPQCQPQMLPVAQRDGFDTVELTYGEDAARSEAARCVQCAAFCDKCVEVCPNRANYTYLLEPAGWSLPLLSCSDGALVVTGAEPFAVQQGRQIIHVDDYCNECGNCATFCVHQGKPYTEKPRLFFQQHDFQLEDDNAFFIAGGTIRRREAGRELSLALNNGTITYEDQRVRVCLAADWSVQELALKEPFEGALSLRRAAEMAVILRGVANSLPFLTN